jgi:hypothetical protein
VRRIVATAQRRRPAARGKPLDRQPLACDSRRAGQPVWWRAISDWTGGVYVVDRRDRRLRDTCSRTIFRRPRRDSAAPLIDRRPPGWIGSLVVNDAGFHDRPIPGNMFVPIDHLKPIMGDLLSRGRRADPGRALARGDLEGTTAGVRDASRPRARPPRRHRDDVILGIEGAGARSDGLLPPALGPVAAGVSAARCAPGHAVRRW